MATVGALLLAFEIFVLAKWITGPDFHSTPTGPDHLSSAKQTLYTVIQILVSGLLIPCAWFWVIRPWRREGRMTTDGMFAVAGGLLFFWDMVMNYTSVVLFYNSNLVNMGAWANGSWPGWTSPHANRLPEPLLIVPEAYTTLVFVQVMLVLWGLRRLKRRRPGLGFLGSAATIILGLFVTDTIVEGVVLRTGLYAYPGGIRSLSLFAGHTYQVPLTETFCFGGLGLGAIAMLMYFRDDSARTIVERGLDRVQASAKQKQFIKFCAIFGAVHLCFVVLYAAPQQWISTHSDPFPKGYPSYMVNGMCASGAHQNACPGPGTAVPRPRGSVL
jgi:hypothetical protein